MIIKIDTKRQAQEKQHVAEIDACHTYDMEVEEKIEKL